MLCHSDPDTTQSALWHHHIVTCYPAHTGPPPTTHRSLGVYTISDLLFLLCSFLPRAITECVIMSPWHPSTQYFQNKITKYEQQWPGLSWWGGGSTKWWICFRPRLPTICYNLVQLCGVSTKCVPRPSAHVEHTLQYSSIDTIKN